MKWFHDFENKKLVIISTILFLYFDVHTDVIVGKLIHKSTNTPHMKTVTVEICGMHNIYDANRDNGTLIWLLFNCGFNVLIKILSFTVRRYGFSSRPMIVNSSRDIVDELHLSDCMCCIGVNT